jgi:hypothetical protein
VAVTTIKPAASKPMVKNSNVRLMGLAPFNECFMIPKKRFKAF